jgi:hypothetical protein
MNLGTVYSNDRAILIWYKKLGFYPGLLTKDKSAQVFSCVNTGFVSTNLAFIQHDWLS